MSSQKGRDREALRQKYPFARSASSEEYRGYLIDTVQFRKGGWHVYLNGPGVNDSHDHGFATKRKALEVARGAVDHIHASQAPLALTPAAIRAIC